MEIMSGSEEGYLREWSPCNHILNLIPARIQSGIFSKELNLTCVDAVIEYIALGTNVGLVYWYDRKKGNIQRLRCEANTSPITYVKIVNTVDYMVAAGNATGQVTIFQIPKEHPENVPENLKPKVDGKVERYTIGDLHKGPISAIDWSKNGMRLFSGDKNGIIIMTEIDFYMHICKSMEIVNEDYEIVQLSYHQNCLLVSSLYRSIVCQKQDGKWKVAQIGNKDRKSLASLGGVFQYSYNSGSVQAWCARAGARLWRSDNQGNVLHTLLFKEALSTPLSIVELLNPCPMQVDSPAGITTLHALGDSLLVTFCGPTLSVLQPSSGQVTAKATFRRILSLSVNKNEIFVLEGPRTLVRLSHVPEPPTASSDDPINMMTKSLTTSIQQAVNTVRDFTHIDQTVPFIASVLEQPIAMFTKNEVIDPSTVSKAEECFELPPVKMLPNDLSNNVLESIMNEFKDATSETEELRRLKSQELAKKLKVFDKIMEKEYDEELIHSRRGRRRGTGTEGAVSREITPIRKEENVSYTSPCFMNMSVYGNLSQTDANNLEKEIEAKEKILAKMLNLESLSLKVYELPPSVEAHMDNPYSYYDDEPITNKIEPIIKPKLVSKELDPTDLVPEVVQLNLNNIELKFDVGNSENFRNRCNSDFSTDEGIEEGWELI